MQRLFLVFLFLTFVKGHTQKSYSISGKITDIHRQPISIGDILVFHKNNDTLVKYSTIIAGDFLIENISEGSYRLRISSMGFEVFEQVLIVSKTEIFNVQLRSKPTELKGVEVVAAKPIITNANGNLKVDVTNPVFTAIPNAIELLARLPNLQVSADRESIKIIGKGAPLIYVGSQRISIEELNALSVADISTIEIIRNPSVKYEADGRAVLLITQKTNITDGVKLAFSETASLKRNFYNYNGLNGSFKRKKATLKVNLDLNALKAWESHQFEFNIPDADINSDYLVLIDPNNRKQINTGGGLFYQINENDYFSVKATMKWQEDDFDIGTQTYLRQGAIEDNIHTRADNFNTKSFFSGNFNYNKRWNSKTNMFAGIQYSSYMQRLHSDIFNNYNETQYLRSQYREQKYGVDVLAYRLDFEKIFDNKMKWESGVNNSASKANSLTNIDFFESDTRSNVAYHFLENTKAAYSQLSGNAADKVNFNVGLRVENNVIKGEEAKANTPLVDREITFFFPKAMLNITIDSTQSLTFNYAKSIIRPNYSNASSISVFINPFLEGKGNVNLLPTLSETLSASFQLKKNSISLEYVKEKNAMYYTIGYTPGGSRAILSLRNFEKKEDFNINITVPMTKGIWSAANTFTVAMVRINDATAIIKPSRPYVYLYTDHQFKLDKRTTISLGGWAMTKRNEGIFERNALVVLNASVSKTFFDKLQCSLRFNDITRAMNFKEQYEVNGVQADGVYFVDAQEIALTIKYEFGKIKTPHYKNKNVDEYLGRIK